LCQAIICKIEPDRRLRAVQHLYPLELSVDKKEPVPAILNPKAETFRPKRDAAVAAKLRVQEIAEDEQ
jgi:hypothetical protein